MEYQTDKVDECTLALLYLVLHRDRFATRAWKGFDWETLSRLHEKGMICDPKGKAKSVVMTDEGATRCQELFEAMFCE